MGTKLYFHDLRGLPRPSPRTPWGSIDPRLRTYALELGLQDVFGRRPNLKIYFSFWASLFKISYFKVKISATQKKLGYFDAFLTVFYQISHNRKRSKGRTLAMSALIEI